MQACVWVFVGVDPNQLDLCKQLWKLRSPFAHKHEGALSKSLWQVKQENGTQNPPKPEPKGFARPTGRRHTCAAPSERSWRVRSEKMVPRSGLEPNPKLDIVEMRALSEPARVAVERQKRIRFFEEKMVP
jgi:hypothetical protein